MRRSISVTYTISLICLQTSLFAAIQIKTNFPKSHSHTANLSPEIRIEFDAPVNTATVNAKSMMIFGRWTGVMPGEFRFEDGNRLVRFLPAKKFSGGEMITVAVSKRVKSAANDSLNNGYAWNFWTAARKADMTLTLKRGLQVRFAGEGPIRTYGSYAGDLNGDGYHDFTVPNEDVHDIRVFINDGKGLYSYSSRYELPKPAKPSTNEGMDFNGDGLIDFAVGNITGNSVSVLFGNGRGGFSAPTTYPVGREPRGLSVLDLEGDGDMDIVTANRVSSNISILYNKGDGSFTPSVALDFGGTDETACVAADANEDGILDLFVGAFRSQEMMLLLGDGKGGFKFSTKIDCQGSPWMLASGDMDGDGHVDVVAANANEHRVAIIRGDGKGNLLPAVTYPVGRFPLAIDLGDLNGDGDLDLITSNYSTRDWTIYENLGNGAFRKGQSLPALQAGSCAVFHDRDLDGDLDMTGIDEEADIIFLFENVATTAVNDEEASELPQDFNLGQAYPNPFSNRAEKNLLIPFTLPRSTKVNLRVVNVLGQTVFSLVDAVVAAGAHQIPLEARAFHPGIYFYILEVEGRTLVKKIAIL